jgi:hypothetical protein
VFKKKTEGGAFQDGKVGEMEVTKQLPTVWFPHHHIPRQGRMIAGFSVAPGPLPVPKRPFSSLPKNVTAEFVQWGVS